MQYEDAFMAGFCKAAEAAGVSPVLLYKQAQRKARITSILRKGVVSIRSRSTRDPASSVRKTLDDQTGSGAPQKSGRTNG